MAKLLRVGFAMEREPKSYRLLKGCAVERMRWGCLAQAVV